MKNIVITECHDVLNITEDGGVNTLSQSEADELANFIRNENIKREYISWDNKSITFINYVGYIQCSTFSIEILPKVAIHNDFFQQRNVLIEMLNESGYINVTTTSLAQLQLVNGSLLEIFGRIYASSLSSELSKGVTTKYLQIEKNLTTLKGALV
ncbi:5-methylcytosine restriction system specificity protein McrC, partial [Niallia taxi]|uniref:5-methylcytosine restriction system specificity protein McrC n=1 Tax=Niallia taxi TaxID=2499688 RepID=UPI003AB728E1